MTSRITAALAADPLDLHEVAAAATELAGQLDRAGLAAEVALRTVDSGPSWLTKDAAAAMNDGLVLLPGDFALLADHLRNLAQRCAEARV
jgi:uncharacterized RDD family membrane protein YckC